MTIVLFLLTLLFASPVSSQDSVRKPLYELPDNTQTAQKIDETQDMLIASDNGLFRSLNTNTLIPLWTNGKVKQIVRTVIQKTGGDRAEQWYFVTSLGILTSSDLLTFELRNNGLPFLTIEEYNGGQTAFTQEVQDLKDLCVSPQNPLELVTATKDTVYITFDGGMNWKSLGSSSRNTSGIKAVAVADMPKSVSSGSTDPGTEPVVFMSHAIFGFSYITPERPAAGWVDMSAGFKLMQSMTTPDEVSDILPVLRTAADGSQYVEIYMAQTFLPNLYRLDWKAKRADCLYTGSEPSDTIDGLARIDDALLFMRPGSVGSYDLNGGSVPGVPVNLSAWRQKLETAGSTVNAAWIPQQQSGFGSGLVLNELWMLNPERAVSPYTEKVTGRKCLYVPAYQVRSEIGLQGIERYRKIIRDNKLNSLVIDMKDDYGLLRYDSHDPFILEKASTSQYATNLDQFVSEFKKDNVYLIARIVVFKDKNLSKYNNGVYAVWDPVKKAPWVGIKGYEDITDQTGAVTGKKTVYYDENWVDPYCPDVWAYNTAIAKELVNRGFDEVQFDYIRFPTDGYNLKNAVFRWCKKDMDKESALISFLSYARANIKSPLGIDIYGANGWYRSGTRTGQDVELLSRFVDVICPMFYPSHFEQNFLNYEPYPDRPYRIYFYGTYRNTVIGRNRIVVRPWVQAFYLNVSFDRQYYNADYVQKEIFGVRDGLNRGYMYWNNQGNYDTLTPDIGDRKYTGKAMEASPSFRKPAFGGNDSITGTASLPHRNVVFDALVRRNMRPDVLFKQSSVPQMQSTYQR